MNRLIFGILWPTIISLVVALPDFNGPKKQEALDLYSPLESLAVKADPGDSSALMEIYHATGGPNWTVQWDTNMPVATWDTLEDYESQFGIGLDTNGRVTFLRLRGYNMTGTVPASALNKLTELRTLGLTNSDITKIESVDSLKNLERLEVFSNPNLDSLPSLGALSKLSILMYGGTAIKYIPHIPQKENLSYLHCNNNSIPVEHLDSIKKYSKLQNLSIASIPNLSNLSFIENLTKLKVLDVSRNDSMIDLPDFTNLSNLNSLIINDNPQLSDFSAINTLTNLEKFYAQNCGLVSLAFLSNLGSLVDVRVTKNNLSSLDGISYLDRLKVLQIGDNDFTSLPDLGNFPNVKQFIANANMIDTLIGIEGLDSIENLNFEANPGIRMPSVEALKTLKHLNLSRCQLATVVGIDSLVNLEGLALFHNNLTHIGDLSNLTELKTLKAAGNKLVNIPGLNSLTQLEILSIANNNLSDLGDLSALENLIEVHVFQNELKSLANIPTTNNYNLFQCHENLLSFDKLEPYASILDDPSSKYAPQKIDTIGPMQRIGAYTDTSIIISQIEQGQQNEYRWFKNVGELSDAVWAELIGEHAASIMIDSVVMADSGYYYTEIKNPLFPLLTFYTRLIHLKVHKKPFIVPNPFYNKETIIIHYPPDIADENKQAVQAELQRLKLVLEGSYCEEYELWEVPDTLRVKSGNIPLLIIGPLERTDAVASSPKVKEDSIEVVWNYPINLGEPRGNRSQLLANFIGIPDSNLHPTTFALIDFGMDSAHNVLKDHIYLDHDPATGEICKTNDPNGYNVANDTSDAFKDDSNHGTFIAGLMKETFENDFVKVLSLQVGDGTNQTRLFEVIAALRYAIDEKADVIGMSLGYYGPSSDLMEDLIYEADSLGIIIVAAAGNEGTNNDSIDIWPANYARTYKNVISVGALNFFDNNSKARFSNHGKKTVTVFAPGVSINGPFPGNQYGQKSGTSFAVSFVTGPLLNIKSAFPDSSTAFVIKEFLNRYCTISEDLKKYSIHGHKVDIELEDCNRSPTARPDYAVIYRGIRQNLSILENDCHGPATTVNLIAPPTGVSWDGLGKFLKISSSAFTSLGSSEVELSYELVGVPSESGEIKRATAKIFLSIEKPEDQISLSGAITAYNHSSVPPLKVKAKEFRTASFEESEDANFNFSVRRNTEIRIQPTEKKEEIDDTLYRRSIDVGDITQIIRFLNGNTIFNRFDSVAVDVHRDNQITTQDIDTISDYILGNRLGFPLSDPNSEEFRNWTFVASNASAFDSENRLYGVFYREEYQIPDSPSVNRDYLDFDAVLLADVLENKEPVLLDFLPILTFGNKVSDDPNTFIIPLTLSNMDRLTAFQFGLSWDTSQCVLENILHSDYDVKIGDGFVNQGKLLALWNHPEGSLSLDSSQDTLFSLVLRRKDASLIEPRISLDNSFIESIGYTSDLRKTKLRSSVNAFNGVGEINLEKDDLSARYLPDRNILEIRLSRTKQTNGRLNLISPSGRRVINLLNGGIKPGLIIIYWEPDFSTTDLRGYKIQFKSGGEVEEVPINR